jgi:AcrR family transcriptional regulator
MTAISDPKPLRVDAQRNREAVLVAAKKLFADQGLDAQMPDVAKAAKVGVGTVYRHFPTKEALLEAVYRTRLRRTADELRDLGTAEDPGAALFDFLADAVANSATKVAVADALAEAGIDVTTPAHEGHDLADALGRLLVRAQDAGAVRPDVGLPELIALLVGASRAAEHAGTDPVRTRIIAVILDGLRPVSPR